ncbi:MAG: MBL fold metallo-hydrolase [Thermoplasmata archaeon]|nr:MBL fold metallo-hydrolase [Thermoplasmata archaeon]
MPRRRSDRRNWRSAGTDPTHRCYSMCARWRSGNSRACRGTGGSQPRSSPPGRRRSLSARRSSCTITGGRGRRGPRGGFGPRSGWRRSRWTAGSTPTPGSSPRRSAGTPSARIPSSWCNSPGRRPDAYRTSSATHTHADHLAGHAPLHARTGAPIYLSHRSPAAFPHLELAAGDTVEVGAIALGTLETPGHTRDHLTLRLGDRIFTGDTLLLGACGRSDLGDGDPRLLYESLHETLGRLSDETEVYPAHYGPKHALPVKYVSTLGFERASNEALRVPTEAEFVQYMTEGWPPKPAEFERIVAANLADSSGED